MARPKDDEATRRLKGKFTNQPEDVSFEDIKSGGANNNPPPPPNDDDTTSRFEDDENSGGGNNESTGGFDPDQYSDNVHQKDFNPLEGGTVKREYTQGSAKSSGDNVDEVEEAWSQPNINTEKTTSLGNPDVKDLPDDEKRKAAEAAFELSVQLYKMVCDLARKGVKISDHEIAKLLKKDEINLMLPYPVSDETGEMHLMPLSSVIDQYNRNAEEGLKYNEEFINNMREPVIKKFMEKNIGLTNDNQIVYFLILETIRLGSSVAALLIFKKSMFKEAKESYTDAKKTGGAQQQRQQQPPPPQQDANGYAQQQQPPPPQNQPQQPPVETVAPNQPNPEQTNTTTTTYKVDSVVQEAEIVPNVVREYEEGQEDTTTVG